MVRTVRADGQTAPVGTDLALATIGVDDRHPPHLVGAQREFAPSHVRVELFPSDRDREDGLRTLDV